MKKAEIILALIALIAFVLNLLQIPGGTALTTIALSTLSIFYMYLSFAFFNGIKLRHILKKDAYEGISKLRIIGSVLTGFVLAITITSILFSIMYWAGAKMLLKQALLGLLLIMVILVVKYQNKKIPFYSILLKRIGLYGGISFILFLLPEDTWLEVHFRNYPDYVQAVKAANMQPEDQLLQEQVEKEFYKMNQAKHTSPYKQDK